MQVSKKTAAVTIIIHWLRINQDMMMSHTINQAHIVKCAIIKLNRSIKTHYDLKIARILQITLKLNFLSTLILIMTYLSQ
jgi:hypothetical protein